MARDNNSTAILEIESARDDATVAAIKLIHRKPMELSPEEALVLLSPRIDRATSHEYGVIPLPARPQLHVSSGPGRPKKPEVHGTVRNSDLVSRLKRQIEFKLSKLPKPATTVRFLAGDRTRKVVAKLENKFEKGCINDRHRATKIAQETLISERQIRAVRRKIKIKPPN